MIDQSIISRREFIKITGLVGGGIIFGTQLFAFKSDNENKELDIFQPNAFLRIDSSGLITVIVPVPEIGQGIRTALTMLVAEELDVKLSDINIEQADAGDQYGPWQLAGGSYSIKSYWEPLRNTGAIARNMLILAASQKWNVQPNSCSTENGTVFHKPTGKKNKYYELIEIVKTLPIPEKVKFKDPDEYKLIGKSVLNLDSEGILNGDIIFGIDKKVPNMIYAVIERSPVYGGMVKSYNEEKIRKLDGIIDVIKIDPVGPIGRPYIEGGIAILAKSTWQAMRGKDELIIEWDDGPNSKYNTTEYIQTANESFSKESYVIRDDGDFEKTYEQSSIKLDVIYQAPHLAHSTMEPMNCIVDLKEDKLEIWAPTQLPLTAKHVFSNIYKIPIENTIVHVMRSGGAFGRRLKLDYVSEAINLSGAANQPVQIFWTRKDDMQHDYYRPFSLFNMKAGIDNGVLTSWSCHRAGDSRAPYNNGEEPGETELFLDDFPAGVVSNLQLKYSPINTGVRCGDWRGPGHNINGFVFQSFIDEIAYSVKKDPVDFRLELLGESRDLPYRQHGGPIFSTDRLKKVIQIAAEKSGWNKNNSKYTSLGIAARFVFGTYVAQVAEVSIDSNNNLNIHKITVAVDCGIIVNKSGAEAQVEGGIIDGIGTMLYREITLNDGKVQQSNFHDFPMLKYDETPHIDIHFIKSAEHPTGLGEMALPTVAPAVCNAIFSASGTRIRKLPIKNQNLININN